MGATRQKSFFVEGEDLAYGRITDQSDHESITYFA